MQQGRTKAKPSGINYALNRTEMHAHFAGSKPHTHTCTHTHTHTLCVEYAKYLCW